MPKHEDKAEESPRPTRAKKPPEYRRFEKLLEQVVKAPPMHSRVMKPADNFQEQDE